MTPFIVILFFGSLLGISFMIGRKLILLRNGHAHIEGATFEIPYLKEVRHLTIRNIKKHGYKGLVETIRLYVKSTNFVKDKYTQSKDKIKNATQKRFSQENLNEKREINKFLNMISEYKHKIRDIKHKIKEEEKNS